MPSKSKLKKVLDRDEEKIERMVKKEKRKIKRSERRSAFGASTKEVGWGLTTASAKKELQNNADYYIDSVLNPFKCRNARVPEVGSYPSSVCEAVYRLSPNIIADPGSGMRLSAIWVNPYMNAYGQYATTDTGSVLDNFVYDLQTIPTQSDFSSNFQLIRTVSLGVRITCEAKLMSRGGNLYVAMTNYLPTLGTMTARLKAAEETLVLDLAKLPDTGIEINWLPLTVHSTAGASDVSVSASQYYKPSGGQVGEDTRLLIWIEAPDDASIGWHVDILWNLQAVPFAEVEHLFERESVSGGSEDVALAYEKAGRQNSDTAIWHNVGDSQLDRGTSARASGSYLPPLGGAIATVAKKGISLLGKQVPSLFKPVTSLLGSLFGSDYKNHRIACLLGRQHLSPTVEETIKGMETLEFLKLMINTIVSEKKLADEEVTVQRSSYFSFPQHKEGLRTPKN
jgi:hypothetical protein